MGKSGLSRRSLLQMLTVGAGSLTFGLGAGRRGFRSAWAAPPSLPRRLIVFPSANGVPDTVYDPMAKQPGHRDFGTAGVSPTDFQLGPIMAPVDTMGLRADFVGIEGLEMKRPPGRFDSHYCGIAQLLTGITPDPGGASGKGDYGIYISAGPSIDTYLAAKLFSAMPWPSLQMGALCDGVSYTHTNDGKMVPANRNPLDLYKKVFGNLTPQGPDPATLNRLARRKSVLDSVAKDLAAFRARLPAEDRARTDAQIDAIQQMEARLRALMAGGSACTKPMIDSTIDYSTEESCPAAMRAYIALTVAAMACDQTRLVVLHDFVGDGSVRNPRFGAPFPPVNAPGNGQHALSHNGDSSTPMYEGFRRMRAFNTLLACELAKQLKAIPEPGVAGRSMLDNTIIYIPSEQGQGHTPTGLQFATLGGKGLGVKTGQYLKLANDLNTPMGPCVPNQRMLVTLLNAMGLPDQTFGEDPTLNTGSGPISGYGTFA